MNFFERVGIKKRPVSLDRNISATQNEAAIKAKIFEQAQRNAAAFDEKFEVNMRVMFSEIDVTSISPERRKRLSDVVAFIAKQNVAGAVASRAYRSHVDHGNIEHALSRIPETSVGHDAVHSMFAYARSRGTSFTPAFQEVGKIDEEYTDPTSLLEEEYVDFLYNPQSMREILKQVSLEGHALGEDDLILKTIERWEIDRFGKNIKLLEFARVHCDPEFVRIVHNLHKDSGRDTPDQNFSLNEFERVLRPVFEQVQREQDVD